MFRNPTNSSLLSVPLSLIDWPTSSLPRSCSHLGALAWRYYRFYRLSFSVIYLGIDQILIYGLGTRVYDLFISCILILWSKSIILFFYWFLFFPCKIAGIFTLIRRHLETLISSRIFIYLLLLFLLSICSLPSLFKQLLVISIYDYFSLLPSSTCFVVHYHL